ncbi:MAG: hypothetical protein KC994_26570, partial [Candidatus Omnitrophica bacterium]|nr:hypothetical protein [Candidatus Omnitrophota bacterium]
GGGPTVDLTPVVEGFGGGSLVDVIIHYNAYIGDDPDPGNALVTADAFLESGPEGETLLQVHKEGLFLLEYRIREGQSGGGSPLAFEAVTVRSAFPSIKSSVVGERILPTDMNLLDNGCMPFVKRGLAGTGNTFVFQQTTEGPTKWQIFPLRPSANPSDIEVYWPQVGKGLQGTQDLPEVCWYCELDRYSAVWPSDPQLNVRGEDAPPVNLTSHTRAQIQYQNPPGHANINARQFTTLAPGMATIQYTDEDPIEGGETVSFQVVDTDDHADHLVFMNWTIGARIVDSVHDSSCNDGYLFNADAANYDPQGQVYDPDTMSGRVFPINEGIVEMWWYEQGTTRQGDPANVCWPVRPVLYNCIWPTTPDRCIIIANQTGSGAFSATTHNNLSIYEQGDPALPGYNPNEEHAIWNTNP